MIRNIDNMELLAPAGSIDSFHAAIEAGADAVYLGLTDFNARLRAENFSVKTLSYLVPYAHDRNVRIYVALNTLIKQEDFEPVGHVLYQLDRIGIDALIVADLGLIDMARTFFPKLRLHASTQMAIHNSIGVKQAEKLGLQRAVLSRELTLEEVGTLGKTASIELELFVHGALCYSISGLCLASSFLGGSSGNRGRCTQVCRRNFKTASSQGYFFSPKDLCTIDFLPEIRAYGAVRSLKIEGRMKGPDYVYTVVRAYREALDRPDKIPYVNKPIIRDFGRRKSPFFLEGLRSPGIIDAREPPGTGEFLGEVIGTRHNAVIVASTAKVSPNDRVRIQPKNGFEGESAIVRETTREGDHIAVILKKPVVCTPGDSVYLTGIHESGAHYNRSRGVTGTLPVKYNPICPIISSITASYRPPTLQPQRETLWIKIDDLSWLDHLHATPCQRLLLACGKEAMKSLIDDQARLKQWRSRLVPAFPPFIPDNELGEWRLLIDRLQKAGVASWNCSNIGHRLFLNKGQTLIADSPLACLNRASQKTLLSMGFTYFTYSLEDDYLNIKAAASPLALVYLFSTPPLFISRIHPAIKPGTPFSDPHNNRFITAEANGLHYLLPLKPFCITHRREKLSELGIKNFIIDLSFRKADPEYLQTVMDGYKNGVRLSETSVFNFKAGLK